MPTVEEQGYEKAAYITQMPPAAEPTGDDRTASESTVADHARMQAAPDPSDDQTGSAAEKVLRSLIGVLRLEAELLESGTGPVESGLTRQKLQLLMQLNRLDPDGEIRQPAVRDLLAQTRRLLDTNAGRLKRRMEAIREISAMISREITDAQSDGTYDLSGSAARYAQF